MSRKGRKRYGRIFTGNGRVGSYQPSSYQDRAPDPNAPPKKKSYTNPEKKMGASNYITILVDEVLQETERAFLVEIDGEEVWLPKSQIADPEEYEVGNSDFELSVAEWIAKEKGLEPLESDR